MVISFALAGTVYYLAEDVDKVPTDIGEIDLKKDMVIGGNPQKYIIIIANVTLPTTVGNITFVNGTPIDCDVPPGHPNPCDPD